MINYIFIDTDVGNKQATTFPIKFETSKEALRFKEDVKAKYPQFHIESGTVLEDSQSYYSEENIRNILGI